MEDLHTKTKTKIDVEEEASPMELETTIGQLSRAGSLSSCADDSSSRTKASKRKSKGLPRREKVRRTLEEAGDIPLPDSDGADPNTEDHINNIRSERAELESFLFNESNKISRPAIKYILSKWMVLENKVQDLVFEKERLSAKLTCIQVAGPLEKSYADVASVGVHPRPSGSGLPPEKKKTLVQAKANEVILIKPAKEDDTRTGEELKSSFVRQLEPLRAKLKIKNVRQTRQKGLLVEVNSKQDIDLIKQGGLNNVGLIAQEPKRINPSIIIYDVDKDNPVEQLKEDFVSKNLSFVTDEEKDKLMSLIEFRTKFNNMSCRLNWIVQIPGKVFNEVINKGRLFMCWRAYRISEYVNITRCYKCHGYGHIAKYCNAQDQTCEMCGNKDHAKETCPNKDKPKCSNCVRMKRPNTDHWVRSKTCPEYLRQLEMYNRKIEWS